MINILVTGANGQLGNEIRQLAGKFPDFNFLYTDVEELDITSADDVKKFTAQNNVNLIINCAAYTAVDKAETDVQLAEKINVNGPRNLRLAAENLDIPFIHVSTDYVFDGRNFRPYTEDDEVNPQSVYGRTKLQGENKILDYKKSLIIRTSWLYSSFGNNFVKTILRISGQNESIKVVFDQIGTPTYAADLALAILKISTFIFEDNEIEYGIYHFSNEGVCSWYDFAKEITDIKKINCEVLPVKSDEFPRPAPRPFYSVLDKSKIKQNFNLSIPHWKDSLKVCLTKISIN